MKKSENTPSLALMPPPFDWIMIPSGWVLLEYVPDKEQSWLDFLQSKNNQTLQVEVSSFFIAKYPITNAQFAKFIEAGGYDVQKWWTEAGWSKRIKYDWTEPPYWYGSAWGKAWNEPDQPVVGVSWYEAEAFCSWLSEVSGEQICLPTDEQWQRAAQGDDGRKYPWGDVWDCEHCTNSVSPYNTSVITSVNKYEGRGDSFFGVVDMAGNVWEWCILRSEDGESFLSSDARVLRGGGWNNASEFNFECVYRRWEFADTRKQTYRGFRVVRHLGAG